MSINFKEIEFQIKQPTGTQSQLTIDDDFFILSSGDVKQQILTQQLNQTTSTPSRKQIPNEEKLKKLSQYPKTMIKFKFPNGMELIRKFKPTDTVEMIFEFMKQILRAESFLLRRPVGKNNWLIEDDTPLYQSQLVPSAVLLVVFYKKEDKTEPYLKEEILNDYQVYLNEQ